MVSPSDHALGVARKVREYFAAGSQEVWLFDTENEEITIRTKSTIRILQGAETLETPLLPGFSVSVETLLAN